MFHSLLVPNNLSLINLFHDFKLIAHTDHELHMMALAAVVWMYMFAVPAVVAMEIENGIDMVYTVDMWHIGQHLLW